MWSIPVLAYHKISPEREMGLTTILPGVFKSQLEIITRHQYNFTSFKKIVPFDPAPGRSIILTFDDGYESVYRHAFPVMQDMKITGVVFIVTDYIGKKNLWESFSVQRKFNHLSRDQLLELKSAGFEVGSHGRRHLNLNNKSDLVLRTETEDSKKKIEDILGEEVISFCYPFGKYNRRILNAVQKAGYIYAVGNTKFTTDDRYPYLNLSRRTVYSIDSTRIVMNKINTYPHRRTGYFYEWLIQRGALVNIWKQNLKQYHE